jgi:pimeloyl-ACP methyl ester carboxylesterase
MRTLTLLWLIVIGRFASAASPTPSLDVAGAWEGALKVSGIQLRLVAKLKRAADGSYSATLDSVDQGAKDIPVAKVKLDGNALVLELPQIAGSYEGKLEGDTFKGTWKQGGMSMPLDLKKTDHPHEAGARRPQEPKPPFPYDEQQVTVAGDKDVRLACTLTVPRAAAPHKSPAVVMITGSGPQDRDEQLLGHKPFLVIADALTRKGVAVLRCDDRGVGKSTGDRVHATTLDFVGDTAAQVAFLKTRADIDAAHLGLIGHSEGGLVAPILAARSKDVAFVVLLAGTGFTGEEILYQQTALIARAEGKSADEIKKDVDLERRAYAVLKSEKDDASATKKLTALFNNEEPEAQIKMKVQTMLSPWFRTFLTLDPRPYLKQVKVPVLALNGERDLQVPSKENLPAIAAALKGNADVTTRELPGLNHLFQTCKSGSPSEYATIDETFAPAALDLVTDWVGKHVNLH